MKTIKKEVVYTMPYETEGDIKRAAQKRSSLYNKFNHVNVYPNGLHEIKIIAHN